MSVEQQLERLASEIKYARKKAVDHRKRAERWDAIADGKVKRAAALGTGVLPLLMGHATHEAD